MAKVKFFLLLMLASISSSCQISPIAINVDSAMQTHNGPYVYNNAPELYDGSTIVVEGVLVINTNARSLHQSQDRFEIFMNALPRGINREEQIEFLKYCLSLIYLEPFMSSLGLRDGEPVLVTGTYQANFFGPDDLQLQSCGGSSALLVSDIRRIR